MYAKLFARITESSLMEESIEVRYVFIMLLAIADATGHVVGTDVAIARRLNIPTADFQRCAGVLMAPDPNSNSMEADGRRMLPSAAERGYFLVNYKTYRDTRDTEGRREYMRTYMAKKRAKEAPCKLGELTCKQEKLTVSTREPSLAQEEAEAEPEKEAVIPPTPKGVDGRKESKTTLPVSETAKRIASIFHRKLTTPWTGKEVKAFRALGTLDLEDLTLVESYYATNWPPCVGQNILRHDLQTFLNNYPGEVGRARQEKQRVEKGQHGGTNTSNTPRRGAAAATQPNFGNGF